MADHGDGHDEGRHDQGRHGRGRIGGGQMPEIVDDLRDGEVEVRKEMATHGVSDRSADAGTMIEAA